MPKLKNNKILREFHCFHLRCFLSCSGGSLFRWLSCLQWSMHSIACLHNMDLINRTRTRIKIKLKFWCSFEARPKLNPPTKTEWAAKFDGTYPLILRQMLCQSHHTKYDAPLACGLSSKPCIPRSLASCHQQYMSSLAAVCKYRK